MTQTVPVLSADFIMQHGHVSIDFLPYFHETDYPTRGFHLLLPCSPALNLFGNITPVSYLN